MRFLLFLALFSSLSLVANAQDSYQFEPLPKGISQGSVTKIIKDKYGFMWFGTRYGLNKFDGISYQHFPRKKDGDVFKEGSYVRDMVLDDAGDIWIATEGSGVLKYDYSADTFLIYKNDPLNDHTISSNAAGSLLLDDDDLWIGIKSRGVNKIDLKENLVSRFWSNADNEKSISSNQVTSLQKDDQNNVWIGTWNGLSLHTPGTPGFTRYNLDENNEFLTNKVVCMYKGRNFWLGLQKGVCQIIYRDNKYHFEPIQSDENTLSILNELTVLSMTEDKSGNLWIGTENGGLFFYDIISGKLSQYLIKDAFGMIISNSVWSLYVDDLGILWIGTFNGGVVKLDPRHQRMKHIYNKANLETEISQNMVSSFATIDEKFVWVGTDGGGLNKFDLQNGRVVKKYDLERSGGSNAVLDLLLDRQGDLWLATWNGMMKKEGEVFRTYRYQPGRLEDGPCGNQLFDLMEDNHGNIWIASFRGGISVYLKDKKKFRKLFQKNAESNRISSERPTVIFQDSQENIWIGTEGDGLYRVRMDEQYNILDRTFFEYEKSDESSLSHNIINIIFEDQKGNIWIGTEGGGLNRFNEEKESFKRFTTEDGLSSNLIYAIAEDHENNLWLSTNNGLSQFNPNSERIRIFDETDGAQSSEFIKGAACTLPNGDLLFGGIRGFNYFTPGSFVTNEHTPEVYITSMTFEMQPEKSIHFGSIQMNEDSRFIELDYEVNDFVIDYAVLNYSKSSKNEYAYMLEGYDDQWIYPSSYRPARYTNVSPGSYVFKVRGSNNDGVWNPESANLSIVISTPWWNTTTAYIVYTFIIGSVLFGLGWLFIKRERLRRNLTIEHLELEKMKELDTMKSRFFANISHEFRTPLTLIISPLKSMIEGFYKGDPKNQYIMMARNADRLLSLINQLLDLSKLETGHMQLQASRQDLVKFLKPVVHSFTTYAEKQYIDFKCTFPDQDIHLFFEKDKIEKIVGNLLSNAFKYTQEFGKIDFTVIDKKEKVQIIIEDTGIGMSKDQLDLIFNRFYQIDNSHKKGTGIGLALTKELVELHKGNIEVFSTESKGTKFIVELKKGEAHLTDEEKTYITDDFHSKEQESFVGSQTMEALPIDGVTGEPEDENLPIVLIVDDNEDIRLFISEHFISDYKILEAEDGEKALKIAKQEIPDIIISDVMMPKMDGYELCKELKLDAKTCHIPFIILTAKASGDSALKGFELGADNYVTKPFNPKLLELRVRNILQSRENLKSQLLDVDNKIQLEPSEVKVVSRDKEFLNQLIVFIEANMSNSDLNIDDVCKEMGLSRTQLYRKLKALVGQSANELIRSIRLKRAAQLIKSNEMTISEITYEVGFNDLQYFRFCFKKQFGVNPSEYNTQVEV
ncbi:two-component regulator propeller domain-containing protein [Ekhidna sp.]